MNENIKRIYIHIGVMKTATSSLQQSLFKSRKMLVNLDGGYLYPQVSYFHHGRLIQLKFTDKYINPREFVRKYKGDRERIQAYVQRETSKFEQAINDSACENVIVSGEQIPRLDEEQLITFKDYLLELAPNAEIVVIACTREHSSRLASQIQQSVKVGSQVDFANAIAVESEYYQNNLGKFITVFGKPNMIVYPFEDLKQFEDGPIDMFFSHIKVDIAGMNLINFRSNEGLSHVAVDILMYINKRLPLITDDKLTKGRRFYDDRMLGRLSGQKYCLPKVMIEEIHKKSMADKIWLKDQFGIDYVDSYSKKHAEGITFGPSFDHEFKCIFAKLKPVIQKLSYDYIIKRMESDQINGEMKLRFQALVHWMNHISKDFAEQGLDFFIANNGNRYRINVFSYLQSLLFFSSLYHSRFGMKKLLEVLIHRDGEELFR